MTQGTYRHQAGIAITLYRPVITLTAGTPNTVSIDLHGAFLGVLHPESYNHQCGALGGYLSMTAAISVPTPQLNWMLDEMLAAHVEVNDETGSCVWEGFVNTFSLQSQGIVYEFGPVLDIINRLQIRYKRLYTGTNPPATGSTVNTAIYEDTDSQRRWGIRSAIINAGERTETDAAQCAQSVLAARANPRPKLRYATSEPENPVINLGCVGYASLLSATPYYAESAAAVNLSAKLADVIDAEPNGILTSANGYIQTNAVQVPENDDTYRDAWTIATSLVQRGTATYDRCVFMVGNDRSVYYAQAPTDIGYMVKPAKSRAIISAGWTDMQVLEPQVQAGRWAYLAAAMPHLQAVDWNDLSNDFRALFIERVTFDMAQGIQLDGTGQDNMPAQLKKYELGTAVR